MTIIESIDEAIKKIRRWTRVDVQNHFTKYVSMGASELASVLDPLIEARKRIIELETELHLLAEKEKQCSNI